MNKINEIEIPLTAEQTETFMRICDKQMARERISKMHDSETSEEKNKLGLDIMASHGITDTEWFRLDLQKRILFVRYDDPKK